MSVSVSHLTKIYGDQKAVDDISFEVNKGEIVGFLGPNGAGKSTTMKIISCFIYPTSGNAEINGYKILEDPIGVRRQIGYLPEQNPLYDDLYIREFLLFSARVYKVKNPWQQVGKMVEITGLQPEITKKIGQLSKGFKQRVGLAQALIHDPGVLLLDEPTSGLDPNQIIEIRNMIREIGRDKTIILSSHILQEVQAMCNRVIIINKGKIIADDPTNELLNRPKGKRQFSIKFKNPVSKEHITVIEGIIAAQQNEDKWIITTTERDIREDIFNLAVKLNNPVLEMNSMGENLETIFQELTLTKQN